MSQARCEVCDYRWSDQAVHGRRAHLVRHDEHLHGVKLRQLTQFERVASIRNLSVLLVRPDSLRFPRLRAERLSRRAVREPAHEGGYDKPTFYADSPYQIVPEHQSHAMVLADGSRGVGMVVFERRERAARYERLVSDDGYALASETPGGVGWAIIHVWLLPAVRGRGLAATLIRTTLVGLETPMSEVAWLMPLSPRGHRLVRRLCPDGFWTAGYTVPQPDVYVAPFRGSPPG